MNNEIKLYAILEKLNYKNIKKLEAENLKWIFDIDSPIKNFLVSI